MKKNLLLSSLFTLIALNLHAAVKPAEAARLGADLTPLGAETAGNAEGTIPAWNGGILTPPAGYKVGDHHPDPFAADKPLYTITPSNVGQYESKLTAGSVSLLKAYADYKLIVYPTRRSANAPQRIYDATKANAITGTLANNGNSFENALTGIPFPLPTSGLEVMWNHLARYRGVSASRHIAQAAPTRSGSYNLVQFEDEFLFNYARPDVTAAQLENILVYYKQAVTAPARQAGTILLAHETIDQVKEKRSV